MNRSELSGIRWELTTHEGNRKEQLRRARKLTLRERLQALEEMAELGARLRRTRQHQDGGVGTDGRAPINP